MRNTAIFNPGKKFDRGGFLSRATQPLPSREGESRNRHIVKRRLDWICKTWIVATNSNTENYSCFFSFLRRSAPLFACSLDAQCSLFYEFELTEKVWSRYVQLL